MKDSIRLSPIGAFSYHWNQCIDSNNSCFVRVGKSAVGFFKATFCKYTICRADVENFLCGGDHGNSLFFKECNKKFKNINIEIAYKSDNKKQNTRDEEQENENENENEKTYNKEDGNSVNKQDFSAIKNDELIEANRVSELKKLMHDKDFNISDENFLVENLECLKPDSWLLLFDCALIEGHTEIALRLLVTGNCDQLVNLSDNKKADALSFFIKSGCVPGVIYLVNNGLANVNAKDSKGYTPLTLATRSNQEECLKILLDNGARINDDDDKLILHYAALKGAVGCCKMLLNAGANINRLNDKGITPLYCAALKGDEVFIKVALEAGANARLSMPLNAVASCKESEGCIHALLLAGADINAFDKKGCTPLYSAAYVGCAKNVKALLHYSSEVDVNKMDDHGQTPLHIATKNNNRECFMALLANPDIDVNLTSNMKIKMKPLHYAANNSNEEFIKMLLDKGATVNEHNSVGFSPLGLAVYQGDVRSVNALCKAPDIDVNQGNAINDNTPLHIANDNTPLHIAAKNNNRGCLRALLAQPGIQVNLTNKLNMTPLSIALINGHSECVEELLSDDKIDVKTWVGDGLMTLMHYAVMSPIFKKFLDKEGIPLNEKNSDGCTPLDCAVQKDNAAFFKELWTRIATTGKMDSDGQKLLHLILKNDSEKCLMALLEVGGVDINSLDDNGNTLLHLAISAKSEKCFNALVLETENKMDVNKANNCGDRPLHCAYGKRNPSMVITLLKRDDLNIDNTDANGHTPLSLDDMNPQVYSLPLDDYEQRGLRCRLQLRDAHKKKREREEREEKKNDHTPSH